MNNGLQILLEGYHLSIFWLHLLAKIPLLADIFYRLTREKLIIFDCSNQCRSLRTMAPPTIKDLLERRE